MSKSIDLIKILKNYKNEGLFEIEEKVGEWIFHITNLPVTLKIKVMQVMPNGMFMGISNYSIQNPEQASPYRSIYLCETAEDALVDALKGFLMWWQPKKYGKQTKFELDKEW